MIDPARIWRRLQRRLWRTAQDERDLDDEIRFHLAREAELRADRGMEAPAARIAARRDFGNVMQVKEVTRDMAGRPLLDTLTRDLRFGLRLLRRSRAFAFFTIASLALGIGGTSAIFSLFNAIVLRPLPVRDPDRLVALSFAARGARPNNYFTYPIFDTLRSASTTLDGIFAWTSTPRASVRIDGRTDIVAASYVTGDYYRTLGLAPQHGRFLSPDDDQPGTATAVVISHDFWQRRFAGDPSAIGKDVGVGDFHYTIVGVEPRGFVGTNVGLAPDLTFALRASRHGTTGNQPWDARDWTWIEVMGRLRDGVSPEQSAQELTAIFRAMEPVGGGASGAALPTIFVESGRGGGQSAIRFNYQRRLRLMLMMLAAVVLLASLNVATLLLARAEARRDEITMRLALGAGRGRIVRQLLTESALISASGGALGLLFAWWASRALLRTAMRDIADIAIDLTPDARVLAFTIAMCGITCVLFGLLPAVRATGRLQTGWRQQVSGRRRRWLERSLVASQTALSLVLLVFTALFVRSLDNLWARDPGYVRSNVALFSTDAALAGKRGKDAVRTYRTLLEAIRGLPGVRSASLSVVAPVSTDRYFVSGVGRLGDREMRGSERVRAAINFLSPGYFETIGTPLVAGRDFDLRDDETAAKVAIVSERLASKFVGSALGQTIDFNGGSEVIGIARDVRYANVRDAPRDVVYGPLLQNPQAFAAGAQTFEIRYEGPAAALFQSIRAAVAGVDPALTVFNLNTLDTYTAQSLSQERLMAATSGFVGGFALLLASIGLYGLMTYAVIERTPEIGLRMALGSSAGQVRAMVLRSGAGTVLAGAAAGLGLAVWLVGYAREQIVDLQPLDPVSFAAGVSVLLIVAAAAAWLPARRASGIDPLTALRHE